MANVSLLIYVFWRDRLSTNVYDKESGIATIEYDVVDVTAGIQVWNGVAAGNRMTTVKLSEE